MVAFLAKSICRDAFLAMHGISSYKFKALVAHYKQHGVVPVDYHTKGRNSQAVRYEDSLVVIRFLNNIAEMHSLALPGRVPGMFKLG